MKCQRRWILLQRNVFRGLGNGHATRLLYSKVFLSERSSPSFTIHRLFRAAALAVSFLLGLVAADVHAGHGLRKVGVGHDDKLVDSLGSVHADDENRRTFNPMGKGGLTERCIN